MNRREILKLIGTKGISSAFVGMPGLAWGQSSVLKVGISGFESIDPMVGRDKTSRDIARQIYDSLLFLKSDGTLAPALITNWETIDPYTWRLIVRDGVKWHDGTDFTARDVANHLSGENDGCCDPNNPDDPDCADGKDDCPVNQFPGYPTLVRVIDDHTLHVTLDQNTQYFPFYLASPRNMMVKRDVTSSEYSLSGTGPYKIVSAIPNAWVKVVRNESFWGEAPPIEQIDFYQSYQQEFLLQKGEINVATYVEDRTALRLRDEISLQPKQEFALIMALSTRREDRVQLVERIASALLSSFSPDNFSRLAIGDFGSPHFTDFDANASIQTERIACDNEFNEPISLGVSESLIGIWPIVEATIKALRDCGIDIKIKAERQWDLILRRYDFDVVFFRSSIPATPLGLVDNYARWNEGFLGEDYKQLQPLLNEFWSVSDRSERRNLSNRIFREFAETTSIMPLVRFDDLFAHTGTVEGIEVDPFGNFDFRTARSRY